MYMRGVSMAWVLCGAQTIVAVIATSLVWAIWGYKSGAAALYGGVVAIVPTAYFAIRVHTGSRGAEAGRVLGAFYRAEFAKLVLTALLFAAGAWLFGQHFAPLLLTCIACLAMNWLLFAVVRID